MTVQFTTYLSATKDLLTNNGQTINIHVILNEKMCTHPVEAFIIPAEPNPLRYKRGPQFTAE